MIESATERDLPYGPGVEQHGHKRSTSNCAYCERRKMNSMDPSFQLRPPSLDVSIR